MQKTHKFFPVFPTDIFKNNSSISSLAYHNLSAKKTQQEKRKENIIWGKIIKTFFVNIFRCKRVSFLFEEMTQAMNFYLIYFDEVNDKKMKIENQHGIFQSSWFLGKLSMEAVVFPNNCRFFDIFNLLKAQTANYFLTCNFKRYWWRRLVLLIWKGDAWYLLSDRKF